jgi:hypothetical protein
MEIESAGLSGLLGKAQEYVQGDRRFPWEANAFIKEIDHLRMSGLITRGFLEYSANDITLTALAFIEVAEHEDVELVKHMSERLIDEYVIAHRKYGERGGSIVRQSSFLHKEWPLLRSRRKKNLPTDLLLDQWWKLRDLKELAKYRELPTSDIKGEDIARAISDTATILRQPARLSEVRDLAKVAASPSSNT